MTDYGWVFVGLGIWLVIGLLGAGMKGHSAADRKAAEASSTPADAFEGMHARLASLEAANEALEDENARLRAQIEVMADAGTWDNR